MFKNAQWYISNQTLHHVLGVPFDDLTTTSISKCQKIKKIMAS